MKPAEIRRAHVPAWLEPREERSRPDDGGLFSFLLLVGAAVALGAALWWIDGRPHLPSSPPDWERARRILLGSELPYEDVIYVIASIGWLLLSYLGLSMALRLVVALAVGVTDGAAWARTALRLSNLVTVPFVRRAVDAGVAGVLLVAAWLPSAARLKADGAGDTVTAGIVATVSRQEHSTATSEMAGESQLLSDAAQGSDSPGFVSYTVVRGDNLWDIARRFYGDGSLYPRIFDANRGRVMATGESFTNPRLIRPDWVLDVPLPAHNLDASGERLTYRVQRGDSLWAIAARLLGNGFRWTEIWELNRDREMSDGRQFHSAGLIYPGWVLELPVEPNQGSNPIEQPDPTPPPAASPQVEQPSASPAEPEPTVKRPVPSPEERAPSDGVWGWVPSTTKILVGGAGVATVGAAALAVHEVVRRNGRGALRLPTRARRRGTTGDAGRVVVAARTLLQALGEQGFADLRFVLARESERSLDFTIECAPGDADALARQRYNVGRRLACAINGSVESPTRVHLALSGFQRLAGLLFADSGTSDALLLVPVGADEESVLYLNVAAAASAVVVGTRQQTCGLVSSWVATLAATHPPEHLMLLPTGEAAAQFGELSSLPHVRMIDETADMSLDALTSELEETIVARGAAGEAAQAAALIALIAVAGEAAADLQRLDVVLRRGPEHSIYTIAFAEEMPSDLLDSFGARVIFGGGVGDAEGEGGAGLMPGQLALAIGREPPLILAPVAVRTEPLQRANGHGAEEGNVGAAQAETPLTEELRREEPTPQDGASGELGEPGVPAAENELEAEDSAPELGEAEPSEPEEIEGSEPKVADMLASRQPSLLGADADQTEDSDAVVTGPMFSVRCFGSFQVDVDGHEITGWTIQKARELLAYLVARGGSRVLREEAAEALWPEEHADHSRLLANAAYHLRRALKRSAGGFEGELLTTTGQRYHLALGLFRSDIGGFEAHLGRAGALRGTDAFAEYERALALYRDDFLTDEPFEWAAPYREQYRRQLVEAAHAAAKLAVELRDTAKAMEIYRAILARDPIDEEAARGVMRRYAKLGDVNGVRKVYKVLMESLRRELEDEKAEPLPETTSLFQELTRDRLS